MRAAPKTVAAPKAVVVRFYQMLSGHAAAAEFLKEKLGWTNSDQYLVVWKVQAEQGASLLGGHRLEKEIRTLWKRSGGRQAAGMAVSSDRRHGGEAERTSDTM